MIKRKKIIHVMFDEKFNDMAIKQFESAIPNIHEYRVTGKAITITNSSLVKITDQKKLLEELQENDVAGVIFHSLPPSRYPLLEKIHSDIKVVWLGFGYDYYSLLNDENESFRILNNTKKITKKPLLYRIKSKTISLKDRLLRPENYSANALLRVDYFSPVLDLEYDLVKHHIQLKAKYIEWNYGTAEDDLSLPNAGFAEGDNILVGNSATPTNNHIELLEQIAGQVVLADRKIIAPLSYGDPHYRDQVIKIGKKMFGDAFVPLTEFMPIAQYISTIRSCGFVMMNHLRQQALGNICMAMLMGAKIYLNDANPLSKWLSQRGAVFGSMDRLDMLPLTQTEREINSRLIHTHWGRDKQLQKTRRLIHIILGQESIKIAQPPTRNPSNNKP